MFALVQRAISFLQHSSDLVAICICTFIISYICYKRLLAKTSKNCRYPPCLKSWPLIGSIPHIPGSYSRIHQFFLEKLPTMGPVIGFKILSRYFVILQTREAITEAFTKTEISNRAFKLFDEKHIESAEKGIIFSNYTPEFKKYHQLTLTILKQFGFGKLSGVMESRIHDEVAEMIADFSTTNSQAINPSSIVDVSVVNVMASIVLGKKYARSDDQVQTLIHQNSLVTKLAEKIAAIMFVPAFRYIPYFRNATAALESYFEWYREMLQRKITDCENDATQTPCFIRSFIEAEGRETYDKVQLIRIMQDLMLAGSETSATTVMWSIVFLANHQHIQVRLQEEIESVVSRERLPSLNDRPQLKFVEAFILELMRYKTILPLGGAHETSRDVVIQGLFIPAKSTVLPNLHAAHMDSNVWTDPEIFEPDRFIDQEGKIIHREKVISFSVGKRSCLGELLARQEIFLFITGLLQNFTLLPPDGCDSVQYGEAIGSTVAPVHFKVRFVPREASRR